MAAAASWDVDAAYEYGALIGRELRAQGYNMSLGGGTNLTREPRNGRTFEYLGEDPILAGTLVAKLIEGTQSQYVIGDIKHYALNDQESGRNAVEHLHLASAPPAKAICWPSRSGSRKGHPAAVMCSYNRVNGDFACENKWLLTDVLKKDWKFPGFVLSDWGGTHSHRKGLRRRAWTTKSPGRSGSATSTRRRLIRAPSRMAELDDHVHRILRSMFAAGVIDHPRQRFVVDPFAGLETARKIEEGGIVLLKNKNAVLPLDAAKVRTIAVIGAHSDVGMISGGGSAQVDPIGGNAIMPPGPRRDALAGTDLVSHLAAESHPGARAARRRSSTIPASIRPRPPLRPRAPMWSSSSAISGKAKAWICPRSRCLPYKQHGQKDDPEVDQNAVIAAVAAANPHTIVVLESGSPGDHALGGYPCRHSRSLVRRQRWRQCALGNVLFGTVNPSGKLPNTFPEERSRPAASDGHAAAAGVCAFQRTGLARAVGEGPAAVLGGV